MDTSIIPSFNPLLQDSEPQKTKALNFGSKVIAKINQALPTQPDQITTELTPAPERPSFVEQLEAGFQQENTITNIVSYFNRPFKDEGMSFADVDLTGYEEYADSFEDVRSKEDEAYVKSKIDRERRDRRILADGPGGVVASLAGAIIDPINLIPIAGWATKGRTALSVAKAAGITGLSGAAAETLRQSILQANQEVRSAEESAFAITASGVMTGILGGVIAKVSKAEVNQLGARLADDMTAPTGNQVAAAAREIDPSLAGRTGDNVLSEGAAPAAGKPEQLGVGGSTTDNVVADTDRGFVDNQSAALGNQPGLGQVTPGRPLANPSTSDDRLSKEWLVRRANSITGWRPDAIRLALSESPMARRINRWLQDHNFVYEDNVRGVASPLNVEVKIRMRDRLVGIAQDEVQQQWKAYVARVPSDQRTLRNFEEFRQAVGRATHLGDQASPIGQRISEVGTASVAVRRYFDAMLNDGRSVGLFEQTATPTGALTYTNRVYHADKIAAEGQEFVNDLATQFRTQNGNSAGPIAGRTWEDIAEEVRERILHIKIDEMDDALLSKATQSIFKSRNINADLDNAFLEKWLITDINELLSKYNRSLSPRIELERLYQDNNITERSLFELIEDDYRALIRAQPSKRVALEKAKMVDNDALRRTLDGLKGKSRMSVTDPTTVQAVQAFKTGVQISSLGGITITSLPDLARVVAIDGIGPALGGIKTYAREVKNIIASAPATEIRLLSAATEYGNQTRIAAMADITEDYLAIGGRFSRGLHKTSKVFSKLTGFAAHNTAAKVEAGFITQEKILEAASKWATGTRIGQKKIQDFAKLGIDQPMAIRIHNEVTANATVGANGIRVLNIDNWADQQAATALHYAIRKNVDNIIITPGVGALPPFMSKAWWSIAFQFKSYAFAFYNQGLLAGLQQSDAAFYSSMAAMLVMGAGVTQIKGKLSGREPENFNTFLRDTIDNSGILTILTETNNYTRPIQQAYLGTDAINWTFGTKGPSQKYAQYGDEGKIWLGPGIGKVADVYDAATSGEKFNRADVSSLRKAIPLNNIFYFRWAFDRVENGIGDRFNLKGTKKKGLGSGEYKAPTGADTTEVDPFFSK